MRLEIEKLRQLKSSLNKIIFPLEYNSQEEEEEEEEEFYLGRGQRLLQKYMDGAMVT